ncbi:MAG: ABC transporter substrate-binding protein [Firmicutes bacterium]|nr:ABC transporter substrate-binding protein [Bacillota bacterium]
MDGKSPEKRAIRLGAVLGTAILLAACGGGSAGSPPPAAATNSPAANSSQGKAPYVIYAELALTGAVGVLGQEEKLALDALQAQVNRQGGVDGHPIEFKILDNESSPSVAVQLASPLVQRHIPLLLNGSVTSTAAAVDALVEKAGPLTYALTPGVSPHGAADYVFSTSLSVADLLKAAFNFFLSQGWTRVAVITPEDATGQDVWSNIQTVTKLPAYRQIQIVTHQTFADSAVSVATQVTEMAAAHPQVIISWATGSPQEVVFKDLKQSSLANLPVLTSNGNQTYALMQRWAQILPAKLYFGAGPWAIPGAVQGSVKTAVAQFYDAFKGMTVDGQPVKPDVGETLAWDPARLFIHLLRVDGLNASAAQYRDTLEQLHGWAGVNGVYNFSAEDHRGLSLQDTYIVQWDAQQQTWVPVSGPGGSAPASPSP